MEQQNRKREYRAVGKMQSRAEGGGTITNMKRIFAFYWVVCERKREIFYHNYTPHTCIQGVSVYILFS